MEEPKPSAATDPPNKKPLDTEKPQAQKPGTPQESIRIERTSDRRAVLSLGIPLSEDEGVLRVSFDFGVTKGLSGLNGSESAFTNVDGSLIGVNHNPATKTGYVHLFLRSSDGNLTFLNNTNGRVAKLLTEAWAESAKYYLRIESISGRRVILQTVSRPHSNPGDQGAEYQFAITVDANGSISLAE